MIYFVIPCRRDYLLAAFICLEIMSHPSLRGKHQFLQVFPQNPLIPTQCLGQPRFSRLHMVMSCQICNFCYRSRMGQSRSQLKYFQWPFQPEIGGTYHKKKAYFLGLYDSRIAPIFFWLYNAMVQYLCFRILKFLYFACEIDTVFGVLLDTP